MTLTKFDLDVLQAVRVLEPKAYGFSIQQHLPGSRIFGCRPSIGKLYASLCKLEELGHLTSIWDDERRPERGYRRRLYFFTTEA